MNSSASFRTAILLSYSAFAVFTPGVAQHTDQNRPRRHGQITVNVNVVQVPVVVRDAQGKPVGNLTQKEDFEILTREILRSFLDSRFRGIPPTIASPKTVGPSFRSRVVSLRRCWFSFSFAASRRSETLYRFSVFRHLHLSGDDLQAVQGAATRMWPSLWMVRTSRT